MQYKLQDLIDMEQFQNLQDRLNEIYSFPSAIIDNDGNILTATAWQDVCTQFHRKNKDCERDCIKSDQYIQAHLHEANPAVSYRCPRGLVDNATPIIIEGIHYGNFFTGQFFLETPDLEFFRAQAQQFGFEEEAYLEAVKKVPIWSQEQLNSYLFFIKGLIAVISESGLKKLREIEARQQIEKSEERANAILRQMHDGFWIINPRAGHIIDVNDSLCLMLGYTREEMLTMSVADVEENDSPEVIAQRMQEIIQSGSVNFESRFRCKNGAIIDINVSVTYLPKLHLFFGFHRDITERKQHENELQAIAKVSTALRTAPTRAEMLPVIVEQLTKLLNCDSMSVEIIDPATNEAVIEAAHGAWASINGFRQPPGTGLNAIISETRQPFLDNDVRKNPRLGVPIDLLEGIDAGAGVPLIAQERLIGFLWVGRKKEFVASEVRLLAAVADIAASAIHRATLHEQTKNDAANLILAYDTTLEGWAHALELREQETERHTRRVVQMTLDLSRALGIEECQMEHIRRGALLHDIGKMGVPDSVLLKPGTLNEREWEIMRRHPEYAYTLLEPIEYLRPTLNIPYCHHERWDGSGYPRGLKGVEIPLAARVFAIVDVWDALTSDRPYRPAWGREKALEHITKQSGRHFDPTVVDAFMKIV